MRHTSWMAVLLCAAVLAACDAPPTMPTPAIQPHPFFRLTGYAVTSLPFTPAAINDSGVIVGHKGSSSLEAAVAYSGGTLTVLPRPAGPTGAYSAIDITRSGHILGWAGNAMVIWPSRTSTPLVVSSPDIVAGNAMNDDFMVVGMASKGHPFRWTPAFGVQYLTVPYGYSAEDVLYVSTTGYIAGFVSSNFNLQLYTIRWAPNGAPTVFSAAPSYPVGLHDSGDIVLNKYLGDDTTAIWSVNGSAQPVTGIPGAPVGAWSSMGRYAGGFGPSQVHQPWTMYDGSVTWLTAPNLSQEAVNPIDVNACGNILATRSSLSTGYQEDSGYVWRRSFTCDIAGTLAGGTPIASPSTAALP